ncbi:hypothetical protein NPIL_277571 [Nephila pilipes]|uniref:Uncharacterized protein n=1 Tax=Nephila pilipes TaxID=299642 RepID=A0A8X6TVW5_NEPPI|nr:hypothetical protein NPIL_277571 [Nephila pilipes]
MCQRHFRFHAEDTEKVADDKQNDFTRIKDFVIPDDYAHRVTYPGLICELVSIVADCLVGLYLLLPGLNAQKHIIFFQEFLQDLRNTGRFSHECCGCN